MNTRFQKKNQIKHNKSKTNLNHLIKPVYHKIQKNKYLNQRIRSGQESTFRISHATTYNQGSTNSHESSCTLETFISFDKKKLSLQNNAKKNGIKNVFKNILNCQNINRHISLLIHETEKYSDHDYKIFCGQ